MQRYDSAIDMTGSDRDEDELPEHTKEPTVAGPIGPHMHHKRPLSPVAASSSSGPPSRSASPHSVHSPHSAIHSTDSPPNSAGHHDNTTSPHDLGAPLDLSLLSLPPVAVIPTRLSPEALHDLHEQLSAANADLVTTFPSDGQTADIHRARFFLGQINTPKRAAFELRKLGVHTEEVEAGTSREAVWQDDGLITVVKVEWWEKCLEKDGVQSINPYIVYVGRLTEGPPGGDGKKRALPSAEELVKEREMKRRRILERAQGDAGGSDSRVKVIPGKPWTKPNTTTSVDEEFGVKRPKLMRKTTSEYEREKGLANQVQPRYVREQLKLAVHRPHPLHCPNDAFINVLKTIKLSRTLQLDDIGIRAYSTAISAIQAYPYELLSSSTLLTLPGCDGKTSALFYEWYNSSPDDVSQRKIQAVEEIEQSEEYRVMKEFYQIWGVGAKTAREFYLDKGWRSLDDVIEFGWNQLSRVQQIGLKFYDEINFIPIPRPEVARIGALVGKVADELRPGYEYIITGGYRRGKEQSGDVDMVLCHRDEEQTRGGFLTMLVTRLEEEGWVTHTLYLGRGGGFGTQRVGEPPRSHGLAHGEGAEELEKAMVMWQEQDPASPFYKEEGGRNVSPHRRVDIILSPPSCVGTAVLGWTGGTTYERDLRRWVEKRWGWKFDSGGVWERGSGRRVELGEWAEGEDLVQCERRVIEGLGLEYFKPELRNTG